MRPRTISVLTCSFVVIACGSDLGRSPSNQENALDASAVDERIAELQKQLRLPTSAVAVHFAPDATGYVRPMMPQTTSSRSARVALPVRVTDPVTVEDTRSGIAVAFTLVGASDASIATHGGWALYRGAVSGADIVHRVHHEGTEDYVAFEKRPAREVLTYSVDVSRVAGLRLVHRTLELLDREGTPSLRVAPPYVLDATGARIAAKLSVTGCAFDTSPVAPWGRAVTAPGASRCDVHVTWSGVTYPALVDPAWTATGKMSVGRYYHGAALLPSGRVLVALEVGSQPGEVVVELFDEVTGTFAATGPLAQPHPAGTVTGLASGKVLVAGGRNPPITAAEIYDPGTGLFSATGSMTVGRLWHKATLLGSGKVLVTGGLGSGGAANIDDDALPDAEIFDPAGNGGVGGFTATSRLVAARYEHVSVRMADGRVLLTGGRTRGTRPPVEEVYDPGTGAFSSVGPMNTLRLNHTMTVLPNGKVLIAGGFGSGSNYPVLAELFDPAANAGVGAFVVTGSMAAPRDSGGAVLLASGKVMMTSGFPVKANPTTELFDPAANGDVGAFSSIAPETVRWAHTTTLLPSGRVLVTGGRVYAPGGAVIDGSAEIFGGSVGDRCTTNAYCISAACVDGVCCDVACNGACVACSAAKKADASADGTCGPAKAGADPRGKCGPQCTMNASHTRSCDGAGACVASATSTDCGPYVCAEGTCPAACTTNAQCSPSHTCANGRCVANDPMPTPTPMPTTTSTIPPTPTTAPPDGCQGAACPPPASEDGEMGGGCSVAQDRGARATGAGLVAALLGLVARRRRGAKANPTLTTKLSFARVTAR